MAKRRPRAAGEANPPNPPAKGDAVVRAPRYAADAAIAARVFEQALLDCLRCNTARKCHDRARAALREMYP